MISENQLFEQIEMGISGCTQSTVSRSSPHNSKKTQTDWKGSKGGSWSWSKGTEPALWGKTDGVSSFYPKEEKAQGDLVTVFQYLKSSSKEGRGSLFTRTHIERIRGNRYKLHQERFHIGIKKEIFLRWEGSITGSTFPRDMVQSPSLKIFKTWLDRVLD